jgi:hypothetical protein
MYKLSEFKKTERKICPTPSSLGLIVHESIILPSKEEGIMSGNK